jgi:hypothetical protein
VQHSLIEHLIFYGKVAGAVTAIGIVIGGIVKYPGRWIRSACKQISNTNATLATISNNHLPHLQSSLEAHTVALQGIKNDVREIDVKFDGLNTRLEDTRSAVHTLGTSFLNHLENASQEKTKKRKK